MKEKPEQFNKATYENSKFLFQPYIDKLSVLKKELLLLITRNNFKQETNIIEAIEKKYIECIENITSAETEYNEIQNEVVSDKTLSDTERKNSLERYKNEFTKILEGESGNFIRFYNSTTGYIRNEQITNN